MIRRPHRLRSAILANRSVCSSTGEPSTRNVVSLVNTPVRKSSSRRCAVIGADSGSRRCRDVHFGVEPVGCVHQIETGES